MGISEIVEYYKNKQGKAVGIEFTSVWNTNKALYYICQKILIS